MNQRRVSSEILAFLREALVTSAAALQIA
jgi:hypothetical protein